MRTYSIEEIMNKFYKLSFPKKADILDNALSIMHQYNGYSCDYTIARAMGYKTDIGEDYEWYKEAIK